MKTKEEILNYLIEPSHLFLKQVVDIAETKTYILVRDLRNFKKRSIPDTVHYNFDRRLQHLRQFGCNYNEYDGIKYLLIPKKS